MLRGDRRIRQRLTTGLGTESRYVQGVFDGKAQVTLAEDEPFDKPIALTNWLHD